MSDIKTNPLYQDARAAFLDCLSRKAAGLKAEDELKFILGFMRGIAFYTAQQQEQLAKLEAQIDVMKNNKS